MGRIFSSFAIEGILILLEGASVIGMIIGCHRSALMINFTHLIGLEKLRDLTVVFNESTRKVNLVLLGTRYHSQRILS